MAKEGEQSQRGCDTSTDYSEDQIDLLTPLSTPSSKANKSILRSPRFPERRWHRCCTRPVRFGETLEDKVGETSDVGEFVKDFDRKFSEALNSHKQLMLGMLQAKI